MARYRQLRRAQHGNGRIVDVFAIPISLFCLICGSFRLFAHGTLPHFPHTEPFKFALASDSLQAEHFALEAPHLYTVSDLVLAARDISQPQLPLTVGTFSLPATATNLVVSGTHAYVLTMDDQLLAVDFTDVTSPTLLSSLQFSITYDNSIDGIAPLNDGLLIAQSNSDSGSPFDRMTDLWFLDPTVGITTSQHISASIDGQVEHIAFVDNFAYVLSWLQGIKGGRSLLTVVDYRQPEQPQIIHTERAAWRHNAALAVTYDLTRQPNIYLLANPQCLGVYYSGCTEALKTLEIREDEQSVENTGWYYDPRYRGDIGWFVSQYRYQGATGNAQGYVFAALENQLTVFDGFVAGNTVPLTSTAFSTEIPENYSVVSMATQDDLVVLKDDSNRILIYEFRPREDRHVWQAGEEDIWQIGQQGIRYTLAPNTVTTPLTVTHTIRYVDGQKPISGTLHSSGYVYELTTEADDALAASFGLTAPLTVTIDFSQWQLDHLIEEELAVYFWNGASWERQSSTLDLEGKQLVATLESFGTFTVLSRKKEKVYLPFIR